MCRFSHPRYGENLERRTADSITQDDDLVSDLADEEGPGVLFGTDGTLSGREVGEVVHETSEYVSRNWL
jgi:hypothetical protein